MNNNLVSIITPVYNAEKFIGETIASVINQTYTEWEMILVDDCSTDKSAEIVKSFSEIDSRIKYHKLEINSGAAVSRNTALDMAKGRYIAFLDSDDLWEKNKLSLQLDFMKKNNIEFSFTDYSLITEDGESYNTLNKAITVPKEIDYNFLLKNTIILCSSVIIDRSIVGDFRMTLIRAGQDTATWLSILKNGFKAYGLNENLAKYRQVKGSISSNKIKAIKRTWNLYRNVERLSLHKTIYYFSNYAFNAIKKRV